MLLVQKFLKRNTLAALTEQYAITAKRHPEFPNLVMLKYHQIESPMHEPIVQECRGLILDEQQDWSIVSHPFHKFFNQHEPNAASINWRTARVYEKLDGSLHTLYWYGGLWRVASSGLPDAGGSAHSLGMTFSELFWRTWNDLGYMLPSQPRFCFMFELLTPYNRVVVPQANSRIVLLGVRDLESGQEIGPEWMAEKLGWEYVRSFPLNTIEKCLAAAESLDPMVQEGFVVCDANFNRVKVKSPRYVALAHLKESCSARRLLDIVRSGESDEFLSYFPEMRPAYALIAEKFGALCTEVQADYERLKGILSQKDFALEAMKTRCSSALFAIRSGRAKSVREFFATASPNLMEKIIVLDEQDIDSLLVPARA